MGKQSDNKSGCLNPWVTKMDARTWWKCGLATWNPPQIHLGLPTAQRRGFPVASLASDDEAVLWPRCRKAQCPNKLPPRGKQVGNPAKPRRQPPAIALKFLLLSAESVQRSNLAEPSNRPCSSTKQHHQRPLLTHISPTMTVRPQNAASKSSHDMRGFCTSHHGHENSKLFQGVSSKMSGPNLNSNGDPTTTPLRFRSWGRCAGLESFGGTSAPPRLIGHRMSGWNWWTCPMELSNQRCSCPWLWLPEKKLAR